MLSAVDANNNEISGKYKNSLFLHNEPQKAWLADHDINELMDNIMKIFFEKLYNKLSKGKIE